MATQHCWWVDPPPSSSGVTTSRQPHLHQWFEEKEMHILAVWTMLPWLALSCHTLPAIGSDRFPLTVAADHQHLVDASGLPFLIHGDTAWSLIAELSPEDAERYLKDRRDRGFNTLVISLIEHKFSSKAPRNHAGDAPFQLAGAFAEPLDAYFDRALWLVRRARDYGFLVLLAPAYLGVRDSGEGWASEVAKAGPEVLEAYGAYLGTRFAGLENIVWLQGGDDDPADRAWVEAIVRGLKRANPTALQCVHGNRESVIREIWPEAGWIDLDTVYTYGDVTAAFRKAPRSIAPRPVIFLEGVYENEHGANAATVRAAAYRALLSGAAGQIFGNNPVWHFSGPGVVPAPQDWIAALDSDGARSMTHLKALFDSLEWWKIPPRTQASSPCEPSGTAYAAARDGSYALAYLIGNSGVRIDHRCRIAPAINARWFDPSSGRFFSAAVPRSAKRSDHYSPPSRTNAGGDTDWLLVLTAK
ncbi:MULTISPECIES: DUF4038 domain-containing protein [unclassified Rhizobium]|uniref:apiosidase-like domain-containing protein n=1 Tax=unclassified Rhizobium TaxID=2613769 RepID=UPI0009E7BD29|nr:MULTISPECIES: DUF4038 domain-containing protein [unclassified Rhizobium]